jgi:hypothetical protein
MFALGTRSPLRLLVPTAFLLGLVWIIWQLFNNDLVPLRRLRAGENGDAALAVLKPPAYPPAVPSHPPAVPSHPPAVPSHPPAISSNPPTTSSDIPTTILDPPAPPLKTEPSKVIVMGAIASNNISWVENELPAWDRAIYIVDAEEAGVETKFKVPQNKGNEGNAYLWYIIEHYSNLPDIMVFLHSHRDGTVRAWHVDNEEHSNVLSMELLRLDTVLREGFVNLRCIQIPGCPTGLLLNYHATEMQETPVTADRMPAALKAMFPEGFPSPSPDNQTVYYPETIAAPCCAQFAVSREQVLQRPKSDYQRYHNWLMTTDLDNYASGRVMEYLWHIMFGREPYYCPQQGECGCKNYGVGCRT